MSTDKIGFADAVRQFGDKWQTGLQTAHFKAGNTAAWHAVILSGDPVKHDWCDYIAMRDCMPPPPRPAYGSRRDRRAVLGL